MASDATRQPREKLYMRKIVQTKKIVGPKELYGPLGAVGTDEDGDDIFFCVEAGNDADTEQCPVTRYFRKFVEASQYADYVKVKFRCVWLSEKGIYYDSKSNKRQLWIYFWWTDATEYGERPDPGRGYPEDRSSLVDYRPLAPDRQ